ncbi:hypothetical protein FNV43_RR00642 [Rhamnella rubrinervis]|uniref:Cytochrome P450 n=1 Tax=Rhamnella rubrinervis TaxID=2594499 RepID=A0A8K0HR18_9ROSA|nr:hypothetical protein FNV43_RR00642 [Rhamnella rubrinervis]
MSSIIVAILAVVLVISIWYRQKHGKNGRKLPPGPRALPIIGNLHQIGTLPHRSLQKLSQKHGHIMSLWLGNVPTMRRRPCGTTFLKTHGLKMADRPKIQAFEYLTYGTKGMAFSEYGPRWRNTRRICNLNLLSSSKIESFASLRKGEIGLLVQSLKKSAETSEVVDISSKINEVVADISTMMILGKKKDDRYDLKGLVEEVLHLIGAFNLADYVPLLGKLDLQRRMRKANKLIDQVVEKIITEYEQNTNKQNSSDFIIALLSMMDKPTKPQDKNVHVYDRTSIKAILVELITAAYDTPAVSVDWTISELIRNPKVMKKLQDELQNVIGMGRMVEEKDLEKLDYLYMVVKESLGLHPVAPFPPRECRGHNH